MIMPLDTLQNRFYSLGPFASTAADMSTLSSEFLRICFFRFFVAAVSWVGDFHILLNGRKAMLSGSSGPAVAENKLPTVLLIIQIML